MASARKSPEPGAHHAPGAPRRDARSLERRLGVPPVRGEDRESQLPSAKAGRFASSRRRAASSSRRQRHTSSRPEVGGHPARGTSARTPGVAAIPCLGHRIVEHLERESRMTSRELDVHRPVRHHCRGRRGHPELVEQPGRARKARGRLVQGPLVTASPRLVELPAQGLPSAGSALARVSTSSEDAASSTSAGDDLGFRRQQRTHEVVGVLGAHRARNASPPVVAARSRARSSSAFGRRRTWSLCGSCARREGGHRVRSSADGGRLSTITTSSASPALDHPWRIDASTAAARVDSPAPSRSSIAARVSPLARRPSRRVAVRRVCRCDAASARARRSAAPTTAPRRGERQPRRARWRTGHDAGRSVDQLGVTSGSRPPGRTPAVRRRPSTRWSRRGSRRPRPRPSPATAR